jgi:cell shape-determining protein MreC
MVENLNLRHLLQESREEVSRLFFDATSVRRELQQEIVSFKSYKNKLAQLEQENKRANQALTD